MAQSRPAHYIVPETISFNKESQAKEQFVGEIEAGEGTVVDKTLTNKQIFIKLFWLSCYLEYSLHIVITVQDTEHVTVG